jgi:hypothetical protein
MRRAAILASLASCGRIGFGTTVDSPAADGASPSDATSAVAWQRPFAGVTMTSSTTTTVSASAVAAGDLVVMHSSCAGTAAASGAMLTAPGWSFTKLGPDFGNVGHMGATFSAVAPDTANTSFTVTWTVGICDGGLDLLGDEFAGGTVDAHVDTFGMGNCSGTVTTSHADDAAWGACSSAGLVAPGTGYVSSADDGAGDHSEYKLTADAAGTAETVTFANQNYPYVLSIVAIAPN